MRQGGCNNLAPVELGLKLIGWLRISIIPIHFLPNAEMYNDIL